MDKKIEKVAHTGVGEVLPTDYDKINYLMEKVAKLTETIAQKDREIAEMRKFLSATANSVILICSETDKDFRAKWISKSITDFLSRNSKAVTPNNQTEK